MKATHFRYWLFLRSSKLLSRESKPSPFWFRAVFQKGHRFLYRVFRMLSYVNLPGFLWHGSHKNPGFFHFQKGRWFSAPNVMPFSYFREDGFFVFNGVQFILHWRVLRRGNHPGNVRPHHPLGSCAERQWDCSRSTAGTAWKSVYSLLLFAIPGYRIRTQGRNMVAFLWFCKKCSTATVSSGTRPILLGIVSIRAQLVLHRLT